MKKIPKLFCRRLGEFLGKHRQSTSRSVRSPLKLYGCALHTECTLFHPAHRTACCRHCADYDPAPAGAKAEGGQP